MSAGLPEEVAALAQRLADEPAVVFACEHAAAARH